MSVGLYQHKTNWNFFWGRQLDDTKPLLTVEAQKDVEQVLKHIRIGFLSDYPQTPRYLPLGKDSDNLQLYHCKGEPNTCETLHQKMIKRFSSYSAGSLR